MIFLSVICFCIGVVISNVAQWGKWIKLHPAEKAIGYWKQGGGYSHAMSNLTLDAVFCAAWASSLLDVMQARGFHTVFGQPIPGWMKDVPVTPALGLIFGAGADFVFDYVAFMLRGKVPFLSKSKPTTPVPQEGTT